MQNVILLRYRISVTTKILLLQPKFKISGLVTEYEDSLFTTSC